MKIYFSTQKKSNSIFIELDVSESITAQEVLALNQVQGLFNNNDKLLKIGVNGEELDGKYKALPVNYRMSEGERLEIYKPLHQDPKERRKNKAKQKKDS